MKVTAKKEAKEKPTEKEQLNLFDIDTLLAEVDSVSPKDTAQRIIDETDFEAKHTKMLEWIKTENVKIIIAFSGGKDSIAMALFLHFELGIPSERIELWHHEIDGKGEQLWDWACTTAYCQAFAGHFGFPLLFSYRKGGLTREVFRTNETLQSVFYQDQAGGEYIELPSQQKPEFINTRLKFPQGSKNMEARWCSSTGKIQVMSRAISNMERFKNCNLLICTGERRVESEVRAEYDEIEAYLGMTKGRRALVWRPIIDWHDLEVWAIMKKYKVNPHPAYHLGWSRCSCQTCVFNNENTWASLNEVSPEKIGRLLEIEKEINFTMYSDKETKLPKSVLQMVAEGSSFITSDMYGYIKQATSPEWTMPLIVENWVMLKGAINKNTCGAA